MLKNNLGDLEPELFFYIQLIMSLVYVVVFRGCNQDVIG